MASDGEFSFEIIKDFGGFGEGKWQKHLTLISWNKGKPVYDLRPWNQDLSKCGKGVTLTKDDIFDLQTMFDEIFDEIENK